MKRIKKILLLLVIVASVSFISGCGKKDNNNKSESKIIGTWEYKVKSTTTIYEFNKDKTGKYTTKFGDNELEQEFTYEITDTKLIITYEKDVDMFETEYKLDGKKLTVKNAFDEDVTFEKK